MTDIQVPLDLPNVKVLAVERRTDGGWTISVESTLAGARCETCGRETTAFQSYDDWVEVQHLPLFEQAVFIRYRPKRYVCQFCEDHPTTRQQPDWHQASSPYTRAYQAQLRQADVALSSEENVWQFQEKLKALHEVSITLTRASSLDDLCRGAIELGRAELGFDRLGLWLINDDLETMNGAYGTSTDGQVQDERYLHTRIEDDPMAAETLRNKSRISVWEDAPLYTDWKVVGQGWNIMAVLWDGDRGVGWLAADNLIHKQPLLPYQPELLQLYSATLGHLLARKKTEEQFRQSEERFARIFNVTPIPIAISDVDVGHYIAVNDSWVELFGHSREEALGRTGIDLGIWTNEEERARLRAKLKQQDWLLDEEITVNAKDGTTLSVLWSAVLINLDQGTFTLSMTYDITDRKQVEQQRLELALANERLQFLTEFLGNISHDLKTPLAIINTSLYLLDHLNEPDRQKDLLRKIKDQTQLLEKFIQDILTISHLDHTHVLSTHPVNLNDLIRRAEAELRQSAEQKNLRITLNLDKQMPPVLGDEDELYRAVINLMENALNYTPEGGSVAIDTFTTERHAVTKVTDTGIGIRDSELPHIFERFYRTNQAKGLVKTGSGLGLAIVKRVIDLHDGTIQVQSIPNRGTVFEVRLPVEQ
ncbi:MAG TPA: ATP-binding protein [Aggregatilineales bacterium]|nr:ATP-binding protein [Aggregatilineales bacterium]